MADINASMIKELRERTGAGITACRDALVKTNGDIEQAIDELRKSGEAKAAKRAGKTAREGRIIIKTDNNIGFIAEANCETDFVARDGSFVAFTDNIAKSGLAAKTADVAKILEQTVDGKTLEATRQELVTKIGENIQLRRAAIIEATGCVGSYLHGDRIGVLVALDKSNPQLAKDIAMHIAASNPQAIQSKDVSQELIAKEREIYTAEAATSGKPAEIIEKMVAGRVSKFLKEVSLLDQPFVKDLNKTVGDLLNAEKAQVTAFVRFEVGEGIEKVTQDFAAEVMAQLGERAI